MTTFPRAESRRLYSWWWDSHISPKNSKWLQENLTDMDMKVKAMIKLIEEDADSFARRAEMYYKKRPELMKLVEEFYRAYRALAERYDHATGALRHAHRTMAEAFPNHIPLALPDESLSNNTKETPSPRRAMFDADDLQKDAFGWRGLKHVNEMPDNQEEVVARVKLPEGFDLKDLNVHEEEVRARVRLPEGKVRKSLNFDEEEEEEVPNAKIFIDSKNHLQPEIKQKENARYGVKHLQEQISQLSNENQKLKVQIELESKHLDLSRAEVENLRDEMYKLESEKDAAFLQEQVSVETISGLEIEISKLKNEIRKLNEEMEMAVLKLSGAEQKCLALEKANQSLQLELEEAKRELEELRNSLNVKDQKLMEAEMSLQSKEQLYDQSNEKIMLLTLEIQSLVEKLLVVGRSKGDLEAEVSQIKDLNSSLNEHNLACALKMKHLEDEIVSLKDINCKLEDEIENQLESSKRFQQEFESLKDEKNEMEMNHQNLTKEMEAASVRIESLETQVKECCSKLEEEKLHFVDKLKDMESVSGRNSVLENSLSDANVELEALREKIVVLEDLCESLSASVSTHVGEKTALAFQIETLAGNVDKLSDKNMFLENSLDDANTELEGLRSKLRDLEDSFQSLSHSNSDLIAQKNDLISQVERIQQSLTNLETTHAILEEKHLNLVKEKDLSVNKNLNLEDSLSDMKKEHDSLIISKNMSLANLENQLFSLQEDGKLREEELETEKQRSFSHMTQIFVLQRFLHDMSNSLVLEKQKYKSLIRSSEIQLAALENQIHLLQDERKVRDDKIEEEEQKSMNSVLEIFVLQRCLSEVKGENFTLLQECQKHLEASRSADELIKQLEDRELVQKENITLLKEHISKVRDGIRLLLEPLNIDEEIMNSEGSEVFVPATILGEIKNLLSSVSDIRDENQVLCMEISVYLGLLKQTGAEKVLLSQELEKVKKQLVVSQREHLQLYDEYEQLCHDLSAADFTNITLKAELEIFTRKLMDSSEKLCNSMEKKIALEEENNLMCVEAMTLENLYLFYKSLNAENTKQLKLLSGDLCALLTVKNGLDAEIGESKARTRALESENKESLVFSEELRSRITISEFDLHFARSFCEELNLEVEAGENSLRQKSMELLKVNDVLQSKEGEVTELCRKLEVSIKEVDEAKIMRSELENKITLLLEGAAGRDKQIAAVKGENEVLNEELNRFKVEVEALKLKEQHLLCELREEKEEVDRCEEEIMELVGEVQASVINAAMFEEKMFELAYRCEGLDVSAMVLREILREEIMSKNSHAVELKKKVDDFKNENGKLRNDLKMLFPLFCSLENGISDVEKHVCRLQNFDDGYQEKSSSYNEENHDHSSMLGVSKLQNLISKVELLQQLAAGAKSQLDQERVQSSAKLESARKEIEELKLKESSIIENQGKEASNMVKDIELDQVSNSFGASRTHGADAADADYNHLVSTDHGIEAVDEAAKSDKPSSELLSEKDLSVYKMEVSREFKESQEEWNRRVMKRLAFDVEKLADLQEIARELKLKMEKYGASARQNRLQFDTLKSKLGDAEGAIFDLIDRNGKLTAAVEAYSDCYNGEEMGRGERSRVLEQARTDSDRIGMVELELQKIDYIFLKLQEEWESSPTKGGDRTPRVLLRDYLYGRKDKMGKKRGYFCGCVRPKTQDKY